MATTQTLYRPPTGTPAAVGDTICLSDGRKWTVQTILESHDNGDQLLRMEFPDADLLTCDWA